MTSAEAAPLVSVIIPCYNQAHFLAAAIASVVAQTYPAVETIVVDDGSTDNTSDVAARHGARLLRQPTNMGVSAARNAALHSAHGEYVIFLDADDELLPDAVSSGVRALIAHPDALLVVRRCRVVDALGQPHPTVHPSIDPTALYREWMRCNFVWTPGAAVFRRDAIESIGGFPADVDAAADYAVYLRLARSGRVMLDSREVVRYRQHTANMSRHAVKMLNATLTVLARERVHVPPALRKDFRTGLGVWRKHFGTQIVESVRMDFRRHGLRREQLRALWVLLRRCPAVFATHLGRKSWRVMRRLPPAELDGSSAAPLPDE